MKFYLFNAQDYYNVTNVEISGNTMYISNSYESYGSDTDHEMSNIPLQEVMALFGVEDEEALKETLIEQFSDVFGFDKLQKLFDQNGIKYEYHFH